MIDNHSFNSQIWAKLLKINIYIYLISEIRVKIYLPSFILFLILIKFRFSVVLSLLHLWVYSDSVILEVLIESGFTLNNAFSVEC